MNYITRISMEFASLTMMILLSCAVVFHLLVLIQLIPYSIVWGGRLESTSAMYVFESVSLSLNLFIVFVIAIKGGYIRPVLPKRLVQIILWFLVVLFSLNTVGNIFSLSLLEALLFTPVTFISAILCFRLATGTEHVNGAIENPQ